MKLTKRINKTLKKRTQRKVKLTRRFQKGGEINPSLINLLEKDSYPENLKQKKKLVIYINQLLKKELEQILEDGEYKLSSFFSPLLAARYDYPIIQYTGDRNKDFERAGGIPMMSNNERAKRTKNEEHKKLKKEHIKNSIASKVRNFFRYIINNNISDDQIPSEYQPELKNTLRGILDNKEQFNNIIEGIIRALLDSHISNNNVQINNHEILDKIIIDESKYDITGLLSSFFSRNNQLENHSPEGRITRFLEKDSDKDYLIYKYLVKKLKESSNA